MTDSFEKSSELSLKQFDPHQITPGNFIYICGNPYTGKTSVAEKLIGMMLGDKERFQIKNGEAFRTYKEGTENEFKHINSLTDRRRIETEYALLQNDIANLQIFITGKVSERSERSEYQITNSFHQILESLEHRRHSSTENFQKESSLVLLDYVFMDRKIALSDEFKNMAFARRHVGLNLILIEQYPTLPSILIPHFYYMFFARELEFENRQMIWRKFFQRNISFETFETIFEKSTRNNGFLVVNQLKASQLRSKNLSNQIEEYIFHFNANEFNCDSIQETDHLSSPSSLGDLQSKLPPIFQLPDVESIRNELESMRKQAYQMVHGTEFGNILINSPE